MEVKEYALKSSKLLQQKYKFGKATGKGGVYVNDIHRTWASIQRDLILYDSALLKEAGCEMLPLLDKFEKSKFLSIACTDLQEMLKERDAEYKADIKDAATSDLPETNVDPYAYIPIVDVETEKKVVVNKHTKEITKISFEYWLNLLNKDEKYAALEELRSGLFKYDPYDISTLIIIEYQSSEILKVNTYFPPAWRRREAPAVAPECPKLVDKLLKHIIPDETCLDFCINWAYNALVHRNETYLVLNGSKGIGKGVLTSIIRMLIGPGNFSEAPVGLLANQFNAALSDKRVISMDEFNVGKKEHTKLKRYINKNQTIEFKGVDATEESETFNSYVIQNNDVTDMYLEYDDRRFSVPDLTTKDLQDVMPKSEIDALVEMVESDEELAYQFGYWVLMTGESIDYSPFSTWKGEKFYTLVYNSLREWQKHFVDKIVSKNEVVLDIKKIRKEYMKEHISGGFPRNISKIDDFFTNYRHLGTDILGTVERCEDTGEWLIKIDNKYKYTGTAYDVGDWDDEGEDLL